jgi:hypothetical protein
VSKKVAVSSPLALNSTVSIEAQPSLLTKGNATTRSEETELETRTSSVSTNEAVPLPLAALNSTTLIKTRLSQLTTGNAMTRFEETELDTRTSIMITSSWIPISPSTIMIDRVVKHCFKHLKGISQTVQICIGVGMLPGKKKTPSEKLNQLAQCIANLETLCANRSNITIRPQEVHCHLSGMINHTLPLIKTKCSHVLQHDFPFARDVDHRNLVKSMEQHPEHLRCMRFNCEPRNNHQPCLESTPADHVNGLDVCSSNTWLDK